MSKSHAAPIASSDVRRALLASRSIAPHTRPAPANGNGDSSRATPAEVAQALEARLTALGREHSELQQAIYSAAHLQRRLCAARQVRRGAFDIAGEIFPVRHLSGDFFQILDLGGATGIAVGDIAGKGFTAGLWFTYLTGLVRLFFTTADPVAAFAAINRELWKIQPEPPMAALTLAWLDHHRGEMIYSNAGQPSALLLRSDGRADFLDAGGPLLGAVETAEYTSGRVVFEPGDALVCHTDGILECRNSRGEEFRVSGLVNAARRAERASASSMLFSLLGAAQDFAGTRPPADDLTLVVLHRHA